MFNHPIKDDGTKEFFEELSDKINFLLERQSSQFTEVLLA